jgi:twitching motility protein PilT
MRDGELDGMQHFDGELEKLARAGEISKKAALTYATNAGNLQVQMVDVADEESEVVITRGF